jgi:hypothetical protein
MALPVISKRTTRDDGAIRLFGKMEVAIALEPVKTMTMTGNESLLLFQPIQAERLEVPGRARRHRRWLQNAGSDWLTLVRFGWGE